MTRRRTAKTSRHVVGRSRCDQARNPRRGWPGARLPKFDQSDRRTRIACAYSSCPLLSSPLLWFFYTRPITPMPVSHPNVVFGVRWMPVCLADRPEAGLATNRGALRSAREDGLRPSRQIEIDAPAMLGSPCRADNRDQPITAYSNATPSGSCSAPSGGRHRRYLSRC